MDERLYDIEALIDAVIASTDVACMSAASLRDQVRVVDRLERKLAGLQALTIGEVTRKDAWNDGTSKCPEAWVAKTTGGSWHDASRTVELGNRLGRMPDTANALTRGTISEAQAIEVARGAAADPNAEGHLLRQSQCGTVKALKTEADRVVARATDHGQAEQDRVHRTRYVRHHVARDGAFCLEARLTKVAGAKVVDALEHYAKIEFETARGNGLWAHHSTYLADGLVAMCEEARNGRVRRGRGPGSKASDDTGRRRGATAGANRIAGAPACAGEDGGDAVDDAGDEIAARSRVRERSGPLALVEVRVDHAALVRGRVEGDEVCEIEGLGPIPVAEAQRLASDSILRVLLVDGGVVKKISSTTRSIPPRLKRAIVDRDRTCVVPGCDVSWNLEIDHRVPFAQGGRTDEENLARLCHEHHRQKTAGRAVLERWEDDRGRPRWAWHPTSRPNEPPPRSFEERWPNLWTG